MKDLLESTLTLIKNQIKYHTRPKKSEKVIVNKKLNEDTLTGKIAIYLTRELSDLGETLIVKMERSENNINYVITVTHSIGETKAFLTPVDIFYLGDGILPDKIKNLARNIREVIQ